MRPSGRDAAELRSISLETGVSKYAEGSCLAKFGDTHVLCTASLDDRLPFWLKDKGQGWITAEYGMLPRSTHTRTQREATRGQQSGRTQEIQRLIGRSLRAVTNLNAIGERQIRLDCDVIQADGGTRTASITGSYVALHQCFETMLAKNLIERMPLTDAVAAISCGLYEGVPVLDLDYAEDSSAQADANFVITGRGGLVEIQTTAESEPFSEDEFARLLHLAKSGIGQLVEMQHAALDAGRT